MECKYSLNRYLLLVVFLLITSFSIVASPDEGKEEYVLIINSYTESTPWSRMFTAPVYKQVVTGNDKWTAYTENMDVMLMKTEEDVDIFTDYLSRKYTKTPPALVIVLGNSAYALLWEKLRQSWGKDIPFLVCVEKDFMAPREYYLSKEACPENLQIGLPDIVKDSHNLTFLNVPEYLFETISLMKQSMPDMKRLIFLADKRYVSAQNKSSLQHIMCDKFPDIELELITAGDTDRLIAILQKVGRQTGILYYSWILQKQQGNRTMLSSDTYRMLSSYTNTPIFTLNDMDIVENGMAGGFFYPSSKIAQVLVSTVNRILRGEKTDVIIAPGNPCPVLNYSVLEQKGFSVSGYPSNTLFYMKPLTFWEQYHNYVYGGSVIILIVILLLFLFMRINTLNKKRVFQEKEIAFMRNYSRLINNMPICYMKHRILYENGKPADFEVLEVNRQFDRFFDKEEDFVGKKGSDIFSNRLPYYLQKCYLIFNQNKKINTQYYFEPKELYLNVLIFASSTPDCVDIFMTDITALIKTQQVLHTVNKKLSMSLIVANVTPWKWDLVRHTILCDVNKVVSNGFSGMFDENQLAVPSAQYFAKIYKADRQKVKDAYEALIQGKVDKIKEEYRIYHPELGLHELEWIETYATVEKRDEAGKPIALIGSSLSITDRKKAEEELLDAKNKAEESNRLKSAFLANMSHEIRTPLNAIVGFSSILASVDDEKEREEYIHIIENNNTLLLQLINDILDLSKIEAGTLDFVYSDVELNVILYELERSMQSRGSNNVAILFERNQEDCLVSIAKNRFLQVIINLINNAIKFTEKGSIRFGYSLLNEKMLYFYVTDTGCGISPGKQKDIFERFVKLDSFVQGTGLGLSICQMIVEHLGGEIGVESETGKGSSFWFTFPYKPVTLSKQKNIVFDKKKVEKENLIALIAEDNVGNFKLFESVLKHDYKIIHAWNGKEAIELFKQYNPHIILMDINMPEMDGYEATMKIRELSADVPVIAVTAYAFASDEEHIMNSGFDDYIPKPLNANLLKMKMGDLLKTRLLFV